MPSSPPIPATRRESWLDAFSAYAAAPGVDASQLRDRLARLDEALFSYWRLGENVVLLWTSVGRSLSLLGFPHFALAEYVSGTRRIAGEESPERCIDALVSGSKWAGAERFAQVAKMLQLDPVQIELPFYPITEIGRDLVDALLRRYSVSRFENRAVVLLDIVGFTRHSPIEQVTLLNSLSFSVNSAYDKLLSRNVRVRFARSPTGDGFYIWNLAANTRGNIELYKLLLLLLADNAIAHGKARTRCVPSLRAAFHVGAHYEFYQPEGLSPTLSHYLVGQVTNDLSRLLDEAMPGQILIGDFHSAASAEGETDAAAQEIATAPQFVERMQQEVSDLAGLRLAGEEVREIRCYLTGPHHADGAFGISRYCCRDKHGATHHMFNAKINIHRRDAEPIFLGIRDADMHGFELSPVAP